MCEVSKPASSMAKWKSWLQRSGIVVRADRAKVASRPVSLLLPGPDPRSQRRARMASLESIGTCSLDADATADSDLCACGSVSERTLHSLNLSARSPNADGSTTPEYVKRTARLFESEPAEAVAAVKKPSYLNLACSVGGYSNITNYDSKLRDGFRSRDQSPGRALLDARDGAPPRSDAAARLNGLANGVTNGVLNGLTNGSANGHAMAGNAGKHEAPHPPSVVESSRTFMSSMLTTGVQTSHMSQTSQTSTSCEVLSRFQSRRTEHESQNGSVRIVEFSSQTRSSSNGQQDTSGVGATLCKPPDGGGTEWTGSASNSKSFIQQRVERLYGPGALAQGFFRRAGADSRSRDQPLNHRLLPPGSGPVVESNVCLQPSSNGHGSNGHASNGHGSNGHASNGHASNGLGSSEASPGIESSLPVLRHLRPEFRAQLELSPTARRQEKPAAAAATDSLPAVVPDVLPAAPEVLLPLEKPKKAAAAAAAATVTAETDRPVGSAADKDGAYFLRLLAAETAAILALADATEADMQRDAALLSEEAQGRLRSAVGQARLLARQKLQQFEGLCHKNMAQSPDEAFPTTADDLAGFWDMVLLQVRQVHALFAELAAWRDAGWPDSAPAAAPVPVPAADAVDGAKRKPGAKRAVPKVKATPASTELRKAREEARAKLMEQRRREMKEQAAAAAAAAAAADGGEMFLPENGK